VVQLANLITAAHQELTALIRFGKRQVVVLIVEISAKSSRFDGLVQARGRSLSAHRGRSQSPLTSTKSPSRSIWITPLNSGQLCHAFAAAS
jgi:hypothetical protein